MRYPGTLNVTTPSDREIAMTRLFDAPRNLVYEAFTRPELLRRWFSGPDGWTLSTCEIDLTVGGAFRFEWKGPGGIAMGMGGVHREIVPGERIVRTELFDEDWTGGEALATLLLDEKGGQTTLTIKVLYGSKETRDAVLASPMAEGVSAGCDKLEELLATMSA